MRCSNVNQLRVAPLTLALMVTWALVAGCAQSKRAMEADVGLTVYSGAGRGVQHSDEEIASMQSYVCDPNELRDLLPQATYRDATPIWKGSRLGVLKTADGQVKRIAISYYGGFYAVLGEPGYYHFSGAARETWDRLIAEAFHATPPNSPITLPHRRSQSAVPATRPAER